MLGKNKQIPIFEQTGDQMKFNPDGYCHALKRVGLSFEKRVEALDRVFKILEPSIKRQIYELEKEYDANPNIRKEYRDDYKIQDFTPIVGLLFHEGRNEKKRERNRFFYHKANDEPLPKVVGKLYNFYQWVTLPTTGTVALYLLDSSKF